MNKAPQYVGVSGITTIAERDAILEMWPKTAPPMSLMLGFLASQKTLNGGECNARSPKVENIKYLFSDDPKVINLVHYYTPDTSDLCNQLLRLTDMDREYPNYGVQLNCCWPPIEQLQNFSQSSLRSLSASRQWGSRGTRVVLQLGSKALQTCDTKKLYPYQGLVTDVLIDPSGGKGKDLVLKYLPQLIEMIQECLPDIRVVIAGGLCADALLQYADIICRYGLSIDAEGKLRNENDKLSFDEVKKYLDIGYQIVFKE